jgi:hypothetical protein
MKVIQLNHHADVRFAQMLARQFGLNATDDVVVQLADQFAALRLEREQQIAELEAWFASELAKVKAELDENEALRRQNAALRAKETDLLHRQIAALKAELLEERRKRAELQTLAAWPAHERASLQ